MANPNQALDRFFPKKLGRLKQFMGESARHTLGHEKVDRDE